MNLCGDIQNDGTYKGWYRLSQGELNTIGLKDAKEKDGYYVNYGSDGKVDVAFEKGVEYEGQTYYKLSSILNVTNQRESKMTDKEIKRLTELKKIDNKMFEQGIR